MPMSWADLNSGNPAWAKKDQFHVARKVEGIGKKLLEKMGWTEGMGLGKNAQGNSEPLVLDFKINREGLSSTLEDSDGPSFMGRKVCMTFLFIILQTFFASLSVPIHFTFRALPAASSRISLVSTPSRP